MSVQKRLKVIAIDDEPMALRVIESHASKINQLDLILATSNSMDGLQFAMENPVDLIFLDIQMPGLTGMQFLKQLAGKSKVALITAHSQYALEGYEYDVIDYLLKPISFDRFFQCIQKMQRLVQASDNLNASNSTPFADKIIPGVLFVRTEYKLVKVNHDDLLYFQGGKDYTTVFTRHEKLLSLTTLSKFTESLPENHFMRVHKSYLVALNKIKYIERQRIYL